MAFTLVDLSGNTDRKLADHVFLIAGVDASGDPIFVKVTAAGELAMSADVTLDPTNLGTSANQTTEIARLTSILAATGTGKQFTGVPSSFALQSADQTVFTLAAGEVGFIQNHSADAPLAVKYGASASTISLSFILKACTAAADGSGGAVRIDNWQGVVSVAKMAGTASYSAWKQAA